MSMYRYAVVAILCWPFLSAAQSSAGEPPADHELLLTVGKSLSIDSSSAIKRVAAGNESAVEFVVIGPNELLVNAKAPGETSIVIWRADNSRVRYNLTVRPSLTRLGAVRSQITREFGSGTVDVTYDNDTAFVRGTVANAIAADRAIAIASTLGKTVNLLHVAVPPVEPQILLMVRFASVSRDASRQLGVDFANGAGPQNTAIGTGTPISQNGNQTFSLSQAVNVLLFRKDLNLLAAIQALENKQLMDILAEPNLLVINGTPAHFVAGGEFPYPTVQPGSSGNSVTVSFKEYGVRLGFLPVITPRGTIRLQVTPEVSSLDYSNSVTIAGTTVPGTSTRRVQTEVELESGQSFVIAGLLDRESTESLSKIPGISSIPVLGKLFQTKSVNRTHNELLILITPEIVRPIPSGQPLPDVGGHEVVPKFEMGLRQPGLDKTGPVPVPQPDAIPIEMLTPPPKKLIQLLPSAPIGGPANQGGAANAGGS
jgi:pilus assembly protein CpaC